MARKKLRVKRIDFMVTQSNYEKLLILCNEERTLTDVLNDCIQWKYGSIYKPLEKDKKPDPIEVKKLNEMTEEEKEKYELANLNWLEGGNQ